MLSLCFKPLIHITVDLFKLLNNTLNCIVIWGKQMEVTSTPVTFSHLEHTIVAIFLFGEDFKRLLLITRSNDAV